MRTRDEELVEEFYKPLFRFALSLTKVEADAVDLVQQTFLRWAQKGHQLRDQAKAKSWLFTTLYREFLNSRRRKKKFTQLTMEGATAELPNMPARHADRVDSHFAIDALKQIDGKFRSPISLFYLEGRSYREIASTLQIPVGTVMSRLSRGKIKLRQVMQA